MHTLYPRETEETRQRLHWMQGSLYAYLKVQSVILIQYTFLKFSELLLTVL